MEAAEIAGRNASSQGDVQEKTSERIALQSRKLVELASPMRSAAIAVEP